MGSLPITTTSRFGTKSKYFFPTNARLLVGVRRRMISWITSQGPNQTTQKRTESIFYQEKKEQLLLGSLSITTSSRFDIKLNYSFPTDAWLLSRVRRRMIAWITLQEPNQTAHKKTESISYQEKKECKYAFQDWVQESSVKNLDGGWKKKKKLLQCSNTSPNKQKCVFEQAIDQWKFSMGLIIAFLQQIVILNK